MSDQGEKTCPLCAEEMDLTDQQLKPCKCGYEICVWCWHHIMDMAEKDESEGRCPACRNPYNKEKIVGTTAKCERLVSEMNVEKKLKTQKGKSKTSEGRKQLGSVRVIQRNLVYVVGLPLNFADEDLLQRREYFAQYGKVLKVSISRTASGAIQQFANSTCSVYITYSKEEEAVRCIRLVHGFILDGRPLRACFGTTKYCHAWLRNMPCSNPDCLYLHEIGLQEDSFTKDEIISAYTRSRVQEITGSSHSMQRRSGNVLPPPVDEVFNSSSASPGKPINKTATNTNQNSAINATVSPPNSSSGRSAALPAGASWGTRPSSNAPLPTSDACNGPLPFSKGVLSSSHVSSWQSDTGKKKVPNKESTLSDKDRTETSEPVKMESNTDGRMTLSDSSLLSTLPANLPSSRQPHSPATTKSPPRTSNIVDSSITSSGPPSEKDSIDETDEHIENACSDILSMSIHENNQRLQNGYIEHIREPLISQTSVKASHTNEEVHIASEESEFRVGISTQETHGIEDELLSFHNQRVNDPEIATNIVSNFPHTFSSSKHSNFFASKFNNAADGLVGIDLDRQVVDRNSNLMVSTSNIPNGRLERIPNGLEGNDAEYSNLFPSNQRSQLGGAVDMGESSIISNILSMDFDPWDESLTSPQNLAELLRETDKQQGSFGVQASRKIQNSSQSRFSFARDEERFSQVSDFGRSMNHHDQGSKQHSFGNDFSSSNSLLPKKFVSHNGLPVFSGTEPDIFPSGHSHLSSNWLSGSRSQISAPPGFSMPSRAPPPGFSSHERTEHIFETLSGNHMLDSSSLSRNQYQTPSSGHTFSNGDIDFFDPAILAVGKGTLPGLDMRSSYSPQLDTYENARFQSFMQRSLPPHQDQRFTDQGDSYGIPSRIMEQTLSNSANNNNLSSFSQFNFPLSRNGITSNGQWDGWSESQSGNNLGMAELLRNEQLGFNRMYVGYEDSKIRMPTSGNLYNGTYGI